jgi:ferrous iron transport protein A
MQLIEVERGRRVRVVDFQGGRGLRLRLAQYGLYPGDIARVVRIAPVGGPVLIEVDGREIALGRGVAAKVQVEKA